MVVKSKTDWQWALFPYHQTTAPLQFIYSGLSYFSLSLFFFFFIEYPIEIGLLMFSHSAKTAAGKGRLLLFLQYWVNFLAQHHAPVSCIAVTKTTFFAGHPGFFMVSSMSPNLQHWVPSWEGKGLERGVLINQTYPTNFSHSWTQDS